MKHLDIPPPQMNVHLGLGHNFIKEIAKLSKEEVRNLYLVWILFFISLSYFFTNGMTDII